MLQYITEMTKMTMKLLLRNKGFLFFALALPMIATMVLNITSTDKKKEEVGGVTVLEKENTRIAYLADIEKFQIKVYNRSKNEESDDFLEEIAKAGMFQVFEVKTSDMSEKEILASIKETAKHDKLDAVLVIDKNSLDMYQVGDDERYAFFQSYMESLAVKYRQLAKQEISVPVETKEVKIKQLDGKKDQSMLLADVDVDKTGVFGNVLALYTVAFLFAGIMILGTILTEKENLVYTRIMLSKAGPYSYLAAKFIVILFTAILETTMATLGYVFLVKAEVGLSILQFVLILFSMALIFTTLSVGIGVWCKSSMTACLAAFTLWVLTALLGGLYFDISSGSAGFLRVATIMPQRWGLKAASLFMNGDVLGYPLIFIVTLTYTVVVLLIGALGLRLTRKE